MFAARLLRGAHHQVRHVRPVKASAATGLVAEVYGQVERDFGMLAPPIVLHSPAPKVMAASWAMLRESLLADGLARRAAKEVVATAVSEANSCPYCVAVHDASRRWADNNGSGNSGDASAMRRWVMRGGPEPFPPEHRPEYLGVAVTFDYLNRMVNVFLPDSPLPGRLSESAMARVGGLLGRVVVRDGLVPQGESARLLPDPGVLPELAWAKTSPAIAGAFTRASSAIDVAGVRSVPRVVRELVSERLADPSAGPQGPSRAWVDEDVARLPARYRTTGRIALLTALASYQVDDWLIGEFLTGGNDDAALVELTAWASWAAARSRVV